MYYTRTITTPLGPMLLAADEIGLAGAWFEEQKYFAGKILMPDNHVNVDKGSKITEAAEMKEIPALRHLQQAEEWLNRYFGKETSMAEAPDPTALENPPLHLIGTDFQRSVWEILCRIPYGQTTTYKEIAQEIASARGLTRMSSQAVGQAVGHNPISVIVPCHRVLGSDGSLTGYAGGIWRKEKLLELER